MFWHQREASGPRCPFSIQPSVSWDVTRPVWSRVLLPAAVTEGVLSGGGSAELSAALESHVTTIRYFRVFHSALLHESSSQ